jgi:hypothetical protein
VLYFVDETWQEINGKDVGALAAVAIPRARYNAFCREIWQIKHNVLGADELSDSEIKGTNCFAKAAFRRLETQGHSTLLQAAEETFAAIEKYRGSVFAVWTTHEEWMLLRNPQSTALSHPYKVLMREFMKHKLASAKGSGRQGLLFFDNRGFKEDLGAACAVQNFISRVGMEWRGHFMQVPHFTPSAVSPGIQAADLVAYLAAHQHDREFRAELKPYWETVNRLAFVNPLNSQKALRAVEEVKKKPKRRRRKRASGAKAPKRR